MVADRYHEPMDMEFSGEIWLWKGPAPWHFVTVPAEACRDIASTVSVVSYGWGMIPVTVRIGNTSWATSLWPKDGAYIVPLKAAVRKAEALNVGDTVKVSLTVNF